MRLPNVKMLLRWSSIMHIYCFVEIALYLYTMHLSLIWYFASAHGIPAFERKLMFALANIELRAKNGDGDSMRT